MIQIRNSATRGHAQHGWLESFHSFSFAEYYDPEYLGFRTLRVINEDRVQPGRGFGTHAHRDMEILTYVLAGAVEHRDNLGNGSTIRPGDVQLMRAGTGVTHSEFNQSPDDLLHLLQIWIVPDTLGLSPSYEQRHFPEAQRRNVLCLVASRDGRDGSVQMQQDVALYSTRLDAQHTLTHALASGRAAWIQVARGAATVNGQPLGGGDGAAISGEPTIEILADTPTELLLFDLG